MEEYPGSGQDKQVRLGSMARDQGQSRGSARALRLLQVIGPEGLFFIKTDFFTRNLQIITIMFAIAWSRLQRSYIPEGCGSFYFETRERAEFIAAAMNAEPGRTTFHWVVSQPR